MSNWTKPIKCSYPMISKIATHIFFPPKKISFKSWRKLEKANFCLNLIPKSAYPDCHRFIFSFHPKNRGESRATGAKRQGEKNKPLNTQTQNLISMQISYHKWQMQRCMTRDLFEGETSKKQNVAARLSSVLGIEKEQDVLSRLCLKCKREMDKL